MMGAWTEEVLAHFKAVSQHSAGGNDNNHDKYTCQDIRYPIRDCNSHFPNPFLERRNITA
jgi:hypothetical protein